MDRRCSGSVVRLTRGYRRGRAVVMARAAGSVVMAWAVGSVLTPRALPPSPGLSWPWWRQAGPQPWICPRSGHHRDASGSAPRETLRSCCCVRAAVGRAAVMSAAWTPDCSVPAAFAGESRARADTSCAFPRLLLTMLVMTDMSVTAARSRLADVIDHARVSHAPVFLTRRGRRVAAVIDADDLERLTQAAEDLADIKAADAARAEVAEHGTIPWAEVKADLGLS